MSDTKVCVDNVIEQIPAQTRYQYLNAIIASINCSLIGSASNIVRRCSEAHDIRELSVTEIENLLHTADDEEGRTSVLEGPRALYQYREHLVTLLDVECRIIEAQDEARSIKRDQPLRRGNINESIDFMSNPASPREDENLNRMLLASGIDEETLKQLNKEAMVQEQQDNERNARDIRENRIGIEWVIDHVFRTELADDKSESDEDAKQEPLISGMPVYTQLSLCDKMARALGKLQARVTVALKRNTTIYAISDVWMLGVLKKACEERVRALAVALD